MVGAHEKAQKLFRALHLSRLKDVFPTPRTARPINITSYSLCNQAINKLDLSAYKNSILIDMNPGSCAWSAALHDRIKPRKHILLEPEERYGPFIEEFMKTRKNTEWIIKDGYKWRTYKELVSPTLGAKSVPPEEGVNTDILFTGNLSMTNGDRLLAQFLNTCALSQWIQIYGRVRFIVWVHDDTKVRYLPRSASDRGRASVFADVVCKVQEIVSSGEVRTGKGFARTYVQTDEAGKLFVKYPPKKCNPAGRPWPVEEIKIKLPEKKKKERKEKKEKKKKPAPPTVEECEAALERIEKSRYDEKLADQIELELSCSQRMPNRNPTTKVDLIMHKKPPFRPMIARYRIKLLRLRREAGGKDPRPGKNNLTPTQVSTADSRRQRNIADHILEHFNEPEGQKWIPEMEHPAWYYQERPELIEAMAQSVAKRRGRYAGCIRLQDAESALEALELPEEVDPPQVNQETTKIFEDYHMRWGRKDGNMSDVHNPEDDTYVLENKLLQHHQREFDPIICNVEEDYWPPIPLALLDFTPILLDPWLRAEDPAVSRVRWDKFTWLLRIFFTTRSRPISTVLSSISPGGENILEWVDKEQVNIEPGKRIRTLSVKELIELAKAWDKWPFKSQVGYLEDYFEETEGPAASAKASITVFQRKRALGCGGA